MTTEVPTNKIEVIGSESNQKIGNTKNTDSVVPTEPTWAENEFYLLSGQVNNSIGSGLQKTISANEIKSAGSLRRIKDFGTPFQRKP